MTEIEHVEQKQTWKDRLKLKKSVKNGALIIGAAVGIAVLAAAVANLRNSEHELTTESS